MAGNEASEKLSWPWRKRGREKGGRERDQEGGKQSHPIATAAPTPCLGFISRGLAGSGGRFEERFVWTRRRTD